MGWNEKEKTKGVFAKIIDGRKREKMKKTACSTRDVLRQRQHFLTRTVSEWRDSLLNPPSPYFVDSATNIAQIL